MRPPAGQERPAAVSPALAAEFAVLARRLDIEVPADLAGGVLAGYRALREMAALVRRAAGPGDGPERSDG